MTAMPRTYYVYILASPTRTLYIGVTNNLRRRVAEHKSKLIPGFTSKYNVTQLVYFESTSDVQAAIAREKQLKAWRRARKFILVEAENLNWRDLTLDWANAP